ncbi:MAG TPA: hypothetical protein VIT38_04260 [Allosphingosinicella sp.]|jgi:hypothetical protein
MIFSKAHKDDYDRRMGIRGAAPIPCVARSLTEGEARSFEHRRAMTMALSLLLALSVFLGMMWLTARSARDEWAMIGPTIGYVLAGFAVLGVLVTGVRLRKRRGYRDPRARVEIGEVEVVVTSPAGRDARTYSALAPIELLSGSSEGSRYFIGIVLDTRLGPIRLEDYSYNQGKAAAGAILKRMDALGLPLVPA